MYANKCIARLISVYFCILFSQWHNTIFNDLFFTVYMTLNTKKSPDYRRINIPPWLDGANAAAEPTREAIAAIFIMVGRYNTMVGKSKQNQPDREHILFKLKQILEWSKFTYL